jgi:hypothetical protein
MEESLLKQLYEAARINKLSGEEMETYHQSVLDYNDVRLAVNYAQREGRKEGIEQERIRSVRTLYALNLDIDLIVKSTGFAE